MECGVLTSPRSGGTCSCHANDSGPTKGVTKLKGQMCVAEQPGVQLFDINDDDGLE